MPADNKPIRIVVNNGTVVGVQDAEGNQLAEGLTYVVEHQDFDQDILDEGPAVVLPDGSTLHTEYYGGSGDEAYFKTRRPGGGTIEVHYLAESYFDDWPNYEVENPTDDE